MIYFNPRPREEGDQAVQTFVTFHAISIHALVKRATGWDGADKVNPSISIHALVKRATVLTAQGAVIATNFNPRPREEGDYQNARNNAKI